MRSVTATAPVRLDLSGGTLDIWPLHLAVASPGVTVNVGLDVPARATVRPADSGRVRIVSRDLGREVAYESPAALAEASDARTCPLLLLSTAIHTICPEGGVELETEATTPSGSGLGGSSALLIAVLGALRAAKGEDTSEGEELIRLGQGIETRLMRKLTGYQDFYPPYYGGLLAIEGGIAGREVERLPVDLDALGSRLRVVYTGEPHISAETNWSVVRRFLEREEHAVRSIEKIAEISRAQRAAFRAGDLDRALELLAEDGDLRREMAPGVTTPTIDRVTEGVKVAGALGTKICGAGGGGCVMVALAPGEPTAVDRFLATAGVETMPVRLVAEGLRIDAD